MSRQKLRIMWYITIALALLICLIFCTSALAIKAHSPDQIRAWLDNEIAHPVRHGNGDCTDFVNDYLAEFWGTNRVNGHAKDWGCPVGFTEVNLNKKADLLQIGDIIQETYGTWGHVCVYYGKDQYGNYMVVDQATGKYDKPNFHQWWDVFKNPTKVFRGPSDTVKPTVSNVKVSNVSSSGYTVSCNVSDNVGVTRVAFPTWTHQNGQDDLMNPWEEGSVKNGIATFRVNVSRHNNETGCVYATHIYVYDAAGNFAFANVDVTVPGVLGSEMSLGRAPALVDGDYLIVPSSKQTMFLDIYGSDKPAKNGTKVTLWQRDGTPSECDIWTIKYKGGFYTIKQKGTNMCLDVEENNGSKLKPETKVQVWEGTGSSNQQWAIEKSGSGYTVKARCSGFCLDVSGAKFENDTKIQQYVASNSFAQNWTFIPYKNGRLIESSNPTAAPTSVPVQTPQAPAANINFSFVDDNQMYFISDTTAQLGYIKVTGSIHEAPIIGCELADASANILARHEESSYIKGNEIKHYFRINGDPNQSDIFYALTPDTKYMFRSYVISGGRKYYSTWREFRTTNSAGTSAPLTTNAPVVTEKPIVTDKPAVPEVNFTFVDDNMMYFLNDTTAQFGYIRVTGNVNINEVRIIGCELADENNNILATHEESAWIKNDSLVHYFRINGIPNESDIFYALSPGTNYKFRSYVYYNGIKYCSDWREFKTTSINDTSTSVEPILVSEESVPEETEEIIQKTEETTEKEQDSIVEKVDSSAYNPVIDKYDPIYSGSDDSELKPSVTFFEPYQAFTNIDKVNLREEPDPKSERIAQLGIAGTEVTVFGEAYDMEKTLWFNVRLQDGQEGFIRGDLLKTDSGNSASNEYVDLSEGNELHRHTYQLFEDGMTWEEAKRYCESQGGHLVTINSEVEQNEMNALIMSGKRNGYWIGGFLSQGRWQWITGEGFNYQNWATDQPDNYQEDETKLMLYRISNPNAASTASGTWNDLKEDGTCNGEEFFGVENLGFICEWE